MKTGYNRYKLMKAQAQKYNDELDSVNVIAAINSLKLQVNMLKKFQIQNMESMNHSQNITKSRSNTPKDLIYQSSEHSVNEEIDEMDISVDPFNKPDTFDPQSVDVVANHVKRSRRPNS